MAETPNLGNWADQLKCDMCPEFPDFDPELKPPDAYKNDDDVPKEFWDEVPPKDDFKLELPEIPFGLGGQGFPTTGNEEADDAFGFGGEVTWGREW